MSDELKSRELLKWIHSTFDSNKYPIYVTENGMSTNNADLTNGTDLDPNLEDGFRVEFYNGEFLRCFSKPTKFFLQIILDKCTVQCLKTMSMLKDIQDGFDKTL